MSRPIKNDISSGNQGWDGPMDANDEVLFNGPIPIHEHVGDEADLESTFPAAMYDRCFVFVNHSTLDWRLYVSTGAEWIIFPRGHNFTNLTATTTQSIGDDFVQFTGTGTRDYDLLAAGSWGGKLIYVRNDKGSGTLNIDPNGSEVINGLGAGVPFVVPAGNTVALYCNGVQVFASLMT